MQIAIGLGLTMLNRAWSPANLGSSLIAWWDAERSDKVTQSGGAVSSWTDTVAGYAVTQATGASKPTYGATSFNGRPGISFDGVDDCLEVTPAPAGLPTGGIACEIWALVDQQALPADTSGRNILRYGSAGAAARGPSRTVVSSVNRAVTTTGIGGGAVSVTDGSVDFSGRHVIRSVSGATQTELTVDSSPTSTNPGVPNTDGTRLRIGASSTIATPSNFWQGLFSTILVTAPLSAAQAAQLNTYLKTRGGIA